MATPARLGRHPIHPILVPIPIGLFLFSFVADVVARSGGAPIWFDLALYTLAGGLIGALLAAVPGLIDYGTIRAPRIRRLATAHLSLNLLMVALFAASLWVRLRAPLGAAVPPTLPVWLSGIGVVILAISGWLGGEMVFVHGVGAQVEALPGEPHIDVRPRSDTQARGA
jgi:uncharacterized membrane protein